MGSNSSTGNKNHPTRKIEEREENGPSENDIETNDYLNDKIQLVPLETLDQEPNPVTTRQLQDKLTRHAFNMTAFNRGMLRIQSVSTEINDVRKIYEHAIQVPKTALNSFKDLIDYFNEPLEGHTNKDQLLMRSFLVWLASQQEDHNESVNGINDTSQQSIATFDAAEGDDRTPDALVKLLKTNKTTVTTLFILLCWAACIKCVKINGVCRTGELREVIPCAWSAVLIRNAWQLVHPHRVGQAIRGKLSTTLIKPDSYDNTTDWEEMINYSFLEHYILSNPEHFIYECYPDDPRWQLLPEAITNEQFLSQELLYHPWWKTGLRLTSEKERELFATDGKITMSFEGDNKSAYELILCCELKLLTSDVDLENDNRNIKLQNFVYLVRNGISWTCDIRLPVTGVYKVLFYAGKLNMPLLKICAFDIVCDVCNPDAIPLPVNTGIIGLGPGPAITPAGLSHPSHRNGIIHSHLEKTVNVKFRISSNINVRTNLVPFECEAQKQTNSDISMHTRCTVVTKRTYNEIMIVVLAPEIHGQYLLEIVIENTAMRKQEDQIVCYYLLIYDITQSMDQENCAQRGARKMLNQEIHTRNVTEIMIRIQDCTSKKIPEDDVDVQRARAKVAMLEKPRWNRKMSVDPRLQPLNIIRQVEYEANLHALIKHLEKLRNHLSRKNCLESGDAAVSGTQLWNNIRAEKADVLRSTTWVIVTLFGKSIDGKKSAISQIDEILQELRQHGLILKSEDIKQTVTMMKRVITKEMKTGQSVIIMRVVKSVQDILDMMARK